MLSPLAILYRDDRLLAVNKPAGLLVHPSPLDRHATSSIVEQLQQQIGCKPYPVHRLDRPTSGVLLFALDPETARLCGAHIAANRLHKTYHAVVRGWLADVGDIDYPLSYLPDKIADRDRSRDKAPQAALTHYRCLHRSEIPLASDGRHPTSRYSLVALNPLHGRKHQLRRHLKHIFHPILGDTSHGDNRQNRVLGSHLGDPRYTTAMTGPGLRLMLHATRLQFPHPWSGEALDLHATPDAHWQYIARYLDLDFALS